MPTPRPRLSKAESKHQQVARHIRNDIEAGVLRDGQVLPSTRELAAEWDTSVFTISEAMKLLADEGLIVTKSRSKRVVRNPGQVRNEIRLSKPRVIIIGGYAGSGKTELGRVIARQTGWPMLDKDTLTRPVVEAALEVLGLSPHDRESESYLNIIRPREYDALEEAVLENVGCGNSAVVTAPFIREFNDPAWISRTEALFASLDATVTFVWLYCDPDTMHSYIRRRGAARDARKLSDWPAYLDSIDINFRPPVPHMLVENCASSIPLQTQAKELLDAVMNQGTV
ncbi:GntR family transcriptional regulator [Micromonospora sp. SL1-18]|uniref:GntR family transcriptional regulator n=1 Tax=Micromonospora sp. SL1-18 TaxID=3399128 RepID=UPI003A4E00D4